jgi:hypothetical protein
MKPFTQAQSDTQFKVMVRIFRKLWANLLPYPFHLMYTKRCQPVFKSSPGALPALFPLSSFMLLQGYSEHPPTCSWCTSSVSPSCISSYGKYMVSTSDL